MPFDRDPIEDYEDGLRALRLAEWLGRSGWLVAWSRLGAGGWEARVTCPGPPADWVGRGLSRTSAISSAHVAAVRDLGPGGPPSSLP